ncbi:DNA mismatch repair protein muts [Vairimorpha necatrix]|uniref:DNA mismatch repair protein muts n=1 Tax=Vairimorpha necatrix TaxID=6039 RepID=A0AAX4JAQ4_9MICR
MHNETIATIFYKDIKLEYCIYENESLYVGRYVLDTRQYDSGISIIKKHNITKIIFPNTCDLKMFKIFKNEIPNIELLDKKHFSVRKKYNEELSFGCLNALIYYLEIYVFKHHIGYLNIKEQKTSEIGTVGQFKVYKDNIKDFLYLDHNTIEDLNLRTDLFKKINYAKTSFGNKQLLKWMLFPLKRECEILNRHKNISTLMNVIISPYLSKIKGLETNGIINIYKLPILLNNVIIINDILKETALKFPEIKQIRKMYTLIDIFDGKELKRGVFPKYDQLVNLYTNLPTYLGEIAKNITQESVESISIVYIPQLGYLVELDKDVDALDKMFDIPDEYIKNTSMNKTKMLERSLFSNSDINNRSKSYKKYFDSRVDNISQIMDDFTSKNIFAESQTNKDLTDNTFTETYDKKSREVEDLYSCAIEQNTNQIESKFFINDKIYLKTKVMNLLDRELGDLNNLIEEFKDLKVKEIRDLILDFSLDKILEYVGMIDALNSLKCFSLEHKCCVPKISKERRIILNNLWNYECRIDLSQNVIFNGSEDFLHLIGEVTILFHIGSHIPSLSAEFCIFDQIYTSINVKESLTTDTSYFYASLKNISRIINYHNDRSLCLIANLGDGTNSDIGMIIYEKIHKKIKDAFVISSCNFLERFKHFKKPISSTEIIIPDVPYEETFELKQDSIRHERMSSVYVNSSASVECEDCLCSNYKYCKIQIRDNLILFENIKDIESYFSNQIQNMNISDKFKILLKESLEMIKQGNISFLDKQEDLWAIKVVNDFFKKYRIEM